VRLDANVFDRRLNNFSDDNQLLNTPVSFPIAFAKGNLYGAEAKIAIPQWKRLSGFASYSYIVGSVYFPVTGGLLLGQDASNALTQTAGRFWNSQDQRNTVRARYRYEFTNRIWAGVGAEYGSGLPVAFSGTEQEALAQYGQAVVDRVNLAHGRVRPSLSIDASVGVEIWEHDNVNLRFQAGVTNINNRLNVIDFAGLFSGNAIGPPRSYLMRLTTSF
jgi:outer membrane receptor for Fe3+-dicitrate